MAIRIKGGLSNVPSSLGGTQPTNPPWVKSGGGGGGGEGDSTVSVSGHDVFINGVGYSVSPEHQAEFIRSQVGERAYQNYLSKQSQPKKPAVTTTQVSVSSEEIQRRINQQKLINKAAAQRRTTEDKNKNVNVKVYSPGTIYQYQIGTVKGSSGDVPVIATRYVQGDYSTRTATPEEVEELERYKRSEAYREVGMKNAPSSIQRSYGETKGKISNLMNEPILDEQKTKEFFSKAGKPGEFAGGIVYGTIGTKGAVVKTAAIYGVSAGAGALIPEVKTFYSATKFSKTFSGKVIGKGASWGLKGTGVYFGGVYAIEKTTNFYTSQGAWEKGKVVGKAGGEITAGYYGFRTGTKLSQPIKTITPLTPKLKPVAFEYSRDVISKGEIKTLNSYNIIGEVRPKTKVIVTTRLRTSLGVKPIKEYTLPSRKYVVSTLGEVEFGKPFYAYEFRQGSKVIRPHYIKGSGDELFTNKINLKGMDSLRKFGFQRLAEMKTGRATQEKYVGDILGKENVKQVSNIFERQSFKIKVSKEMTIAKPSKAPGKQTSSSLAFSESEMIKENSINEYYKINTVFKDVTKPFARARGITPELKTNLIKLKEPIILDNDKDVEILSPANIEKTPMSSSFVKQTQLQNKILLPKPNLPKTKIPKTKKK